MQLRYIPPIWGEYTAHLCQNMSQMRGNFEYFGQEYNK
jgi:hypothetical protein